MKEIVLRAFQEDAVEELETKLLAASKWYSETGTKQAVLLSSIMGSGKTIMLTALIERILERSENSEGGQATFLWLSYLPEVNRQTMKKMDRSKVLNALRTGASSLSTLQEIKSDFNEECLDDGTVYFLSIPKLMSTGLLTRSRDGKPSIWKTVDNTIKTKRGQFYVVIDEAHIGMPEESGQEKRKKKKADTLVKRFLIGHSDPKGKGDDMRPSPIVIGVTATPERFKRFLSENVPDEHIRHMEECRVPSQEVREAGLIKDTLVYRSQDPENVSNKHLHSNEMSYMKAAASAWKELDDSWKKYCEDRDDDDVKPILLVQVEDATSEHKTTKTPIGRVIDVINSAVKLPRDAFVHTFEQKKGIPFDGHWVEYKSPSQIASHPGNVRVVFFKKNLSTGWDCPPAEVMMSFRKAKDATYIAQAIGRVLRTPLARSIDSDDRLNEARVFLPHFDTRGIETLIGYLNDSLLLDGGMPIVNAAEKQEFERRSGTEAIFSTLNGLVIDVVPSRRPDNQIELLSRLAQRLNDDGIVLGARRAYEEAMVAKMKDLFDRQNPASLLERGATVSQTETRLDLKSEDPKTGISAFARVRETKADEDIDRSFEAAGEEVGGILHMELLRSLVQSGGNESEIRDSKAQVVAFLRQRQVIAKIEAFAADEVKLLLEDEDNHNQIRSLLPKERAEFYDAFRSKARLPMKSEIKMPETLSVRVPKDSKTWPNHLYVAKKDNNFRIKLTGWEERLLRDALAESSVIGWLRNTPRRGSSIQVPYQYGQRGELRPFYPDFLVFRKVGGNIVIDILDPHLDDLDDAVYKAKGLCDFAVRHGGQFGRIESIIEDERERMFRLDLQNSDIRSEITRAADSAHSGAMLKEIYRNRGRAEATKGRVVNGSAPFVPETRRSRSTSKAVDSEEIAEEIAERASLKLAMPLPD